MGFFSVVASNIRSLGSVVRTIAASLVHLGPDDSGIRTDEATVVAFVHQSMASAYGGYVIVLNGEIYNHLDLRTSLESQSVFVAITGYSDSRKSLNHRDRPGRCNLRVCLIACRVFCDAAVDR